MWSQGDRFIAGVLTPGLVCVCLGRFIHLKRYDSAAAELASAICCPIHGLHFSDDDKRRLLAAVTNTLKQLCKQDTADATQKLEGNKNAVGATIEGAGGAGNSGAFLNALIAYNVATTTHFNVWCARRSRHSF